MVTVDPDQLWMIIVGFIIAFVLAFGIGGNDVANSFGTSYGAKVLTMRQVCILASIFETLGAILLGAKVSDTIRKGIIDIEPYKNDTDTLMIGNVAALSGSCLWLIIATLLRLPVSATHSIVGATVGFALVAHGLSGINWSKMGMIIGSWFISPVLAGAVSVGLFFVCKFFILTKADPLEPGLRWLPVFYAATVVINLFSVFYDGPEMLHFDRIPLWGTFVLSFGSGVICAIIVRFAVVPWQRRTIKDECAKQQASAVEAGGGGDTSKPDATCKTYVPGGGGYSSINNGHAVRFDLGADNCSSGANSSNTSQDELNKNDDLEKAPLKQNTLEVENKKNSISEDSGHHHHHGIHLHAPLPATAKFLADISHQPAHHPTPAAATATNNNATANAKKTRSKAEDAPLMDNEYKLGGAVTPAGSCSPSRSPTSEDLLKNGVNGKVINGKPQIPSKMVDGGGDASQVENVLSDRPETAKLFSFLQILTAIFGAFAHGGNDVSNAIGPLVSLWLIGSTGEVSAKAATPIWILLYGGVGISLGLWIWGIRVIKTMGEDLTKITPSSGFCIEIGTALTVLIASNIGIPISTTHCKVGSIVFVGRFRSKDNVDWSIFRNIVLAWVVTLPITCAISAAMMALLQLTL